MRYARGDTRTSRRTFGALVAGLFGLAASGAAAAAPDAKLPAGQSLSAGDRLAIIELIAIYAWAYDTEDGEALASTFTDDGVLEVFGGVKASDRAGFIAMIEEAKGMKGEHGWQHLNNHHVFRDYDGTRCTVYSYYTMPESDANGGNVTVRAMGYYVSDCVRTTAGWRFTKRSVVRWNGKAPMAL